MIALALLAAGCAVLVLSVAGAPALTRFGEAEQDAPPASAAGGAP
ncbi:hypothetical protein ACH5AL_18460 [Actinacidiphila glaucinigra]